MILEGTRLVAEWLADETYGINALLATISLDGSDSQPPDVADIQTEFDDVSVALRRVPDGQTTPALWLFGMDRIILAGGVTTEYRSGDHPLVIGYVHSDLDTQEGLQAASYTLRTVTWSLAALQRQPSATRTNNTVALENVTSIDWMPPFVPLDDGMLTGGLIASLKLRDLSAQP